MTTTVFARMAGEPLDALEIAVLDLASHGLTNAQIGLREHLPLDTVKTVMRRIMAKLGARDRAHAVRIGFRLGYLQFDQHPVVVHSVADAS